MRSAPSFVRLVLVTAASSLAAACSDSTAPNDRTLAPGATPAARTFLHFVSQPGDWVGQGQTWNYSYGDGQWFTYGDTLQGGLSRLGVSFEQSAFVNWDFYIVAPEGQRLHVGKYENAQSYVDASHAVLSLTGEGRGCTVVGSFEIRELVLKPDKTVDRLQVLFSQRCENSTAGLSGEIDVHANPWM